MNLVALLCALAASGQEPLAQTLSPEFRATRVPVMLKQLTRDTGVILEAEPRFTNEVLILSAKNVKLDDLMKRIADVCDATWERTKEGYRLKRTAATQRNLIERDIKLRADAIQEVLDDEAKVLAKLDTPEKRGEAVIEGFASARRAAEKDNGERLGLAAFYQPSHQFYLKLMISLGGQRLASQSVGARVPYATPANPSQVPFPDSYKGYLAELYETGDAVRRLFDEKGPREVASYVSQEWLKPFFEPFQIRKSILVVINDHWGLYGYITMYDPAGKVIARNAGIRVVYSFAAPPYTPSFQFEPVALSPATQELQACMSFEPTDDMIPSDKSMSSDGIERLINPEKHDPLAYHVTDAFLSMAKQTNRLLIGRLSDELLKATRPKQRTSPLILSSYLAAATALGQTVTDRDGWITLGLTNPAYVERTRTKRESLGRLLRASWTEKRMSLTDYCRFQYENDSVPDTTGITKTYKGVMIGLGVPSRVASGWIPPRLLAFLGALGPGQWRSLLAGEPVHLSQLSTDQKAAFAKAIPIATKREGHEGDEFPLEILCQPSESLPFGPGKDTILRFTPNQEDVIMGIGEGAFSKLPLRPDRMGQWLAFKAFEEKTEDFVHLLPKELSVGTRKGFKWEIELIPGIVYGPSDVYETAVMQPKKKSFNQLPEDYQKQVRKIFQEELAILNKGG